MCIYIYIHICICVYVCLYIYIYIYIYGPVAPYCAPPNTPGDIPLRACFEGISKEAMHLGLED